MGDEMVCANILRPIESLFETIFVSQFETILCDRLEGRRTHKRIKRVCVLQYCTVISL